MTHQIGDRVEVADGDTWRPATVTGVLLILALPNGDAIAVRPADVRPAGADKTPADPGPADVRLPGAVTDGKRAKVVHLLIPQGNYLHDPLGVFSSNAMAERAQIRAEQSNDGYHLLLIKPLELDTWQLRAFDRLQFDKTLTAPPPRWSRDGLT